MSWLREKDSDLADALTDRCLEGLLSVRSRGPGVTFIYPGKSVSEKIVKGAYDSDKAKVEESEKLVKAHIIPTLVTAGSEFTTKIGSLAGGQLEASEKKASEVTIKDGGAKVKRIADAKILRDKVAIWEVTSGSLPASGSFDPDTLRGKKGGDAAAPVGFQLSRSEKTFQLLEHFQIHARSSSPNAKAEAFRVFHAAIVSLLAHLKNCCSDPAAKLAFATILSVLDRNPLVAWCILVEPFRNGDHLLPDSVWRTWDQRDADPVEATRRKIKFFESPQDAVTVSLPEISGAKIFSQPDQVEAAVEACREAIMTRAASSNPCQLMSDAYENSLSKNRLGSVDNIWPDGVCAVLGNGRKLWQDALRGKVKCCFVEQTSFAASASAACSIVSEALPGQDFLGEFMSVCGGAGQIAVKGPIYDTISKNLNSKDFYAFPRQTSKLSSTPSIHERPTDRPVFNADLQAQADLEEAHGFKEQPASPDF